MGGGSTSSDIEVGGSTSTDSGSGTAGGKGVVIGAVVGSVVGVVFIGAVTFWLMGRKRGNTASTAKLNQSEDDGKPSFAGAPPKELHVMSHDCSELLGPPPIKPACACISPRGTVRSFKSPAVSSTT